MSAAPLVGEAEAGGAEVAGCRPRNNRTALNFGETLLHRIFFCGKKPKLLFLE